MTDPNSKAGSAAEFPGGPTSMRKKIGLWLGPILYIYFKFFTELDPDNASVSTMAGIAALMATWWITEAIPIPATALVPLVLFPTSGIMGERSVAPLYANYLIFLFMGGFIIALAVERWNLHKRIALHILNVIGGQPHRLVLGFMVATGFLSMWLSNTATTMMMVPMALSLVALYDELNAERVKLGQAVDPRAANFGLVLMLSLAHGASIGGLATIIGTPPNGVLMSQLSQLFPEAPEISFIKWMMFALPFSVVFMIIAWFLLTRVIFPLPSEIPFSGANYIRDEIEKLGPVSTEEKRVGAVFAGVALLWMSRPLWSGQLFPDPGNPEGRPWAQDGTISITMALLLFLIPAGKDKGGMLMDWQTTKKLPWGILLLFGGGLALAGGFEASGLSLWIGDQLSVLSEFPPVAIVVSVIAVGAGLTELTSNTATATMFLPIMGSLGQAIEVNPLLLMIPAVLASSCAFVLPVSTPPNAIVYATDRIPILKMIKAGIVLEFVALILITALVFLLGDPMFDLTGGMPDWAVPPSPAP